jgi:hypothetical protein
MLTITIIMAMITTTRMKMTMNIITNCKLKIYNQYILLIRTLEACTHVLAEVILFNTNNFIVFIQPNVLYAKKSSRENITWYRAFVKALKSRGQPRRRGAIKFEQTHNQKLSVSQRARAWISGIVSKMKKTKSKQRSTSTRTEEPHKNSKINAVKEETSEIATPYSRLVQSQNTRCSNHDAANNAMDHNEISADEEQQEEQC